jgi:SPP1 family predicted phage head-tail adaptor
MKAGKLRHRIAIERREVAYDDLGHETQSWQPIATVWAEVKELSGRELERARQIVAEVTVQVTTRAADLLTSDRILFKSRVLEVASAVADTVNTERICLCTEVKP